MNELLEKAKNVPRSRNKKNTITQDEIELAFAYIYGDVSLNQVAVAIGRKATNTYLFILQALSKYIVDKDIRP